MSNLIETVRAYLEAQRVDHDAYTMQTMRDNMRDALAAHDAAVQAGAWYVDPNDGPSSHIGPVVKDAAGAVALIVYAGDSAASRANAARIVECVNALQGIADPAAFVAAAVTIGLPRDPGAMDSDGMRAFYSVDVFDVSDARSAATWAWDAVRNSTGPIFTIVGPSGNICDVDLCGSDA